MCKQFNGSALLFLPVNGIFTFFKRGHGIVELKEVSNAFCECWFSSAGDNNLHFGMTTPTVNKPNIMSRLSCCDEKIR